MAKYQHVRVPDEGERIQAKDGRLVVPDRPIIPFIEGDGIGRDIWRATKLVLESAVEKAYRGQKRIVWMELYAGEKAQRVTGHSRVQGRDQGAAHDPRGLGLPQP